MTKTQAIDAISRRNIDNKKRFNDAVTAVTILEDCETGQEVQCVFNQYMRGEI